MFTGAYPVPVESRQYPYTLISLGDYKWCERLHKFIGKNRSHHL